MENPREPRSIGEAQARKRELERDIMSIERQLGDKLRGGRDGKLSKKEYASWRASAHSALVSKKTEQTYLKDWIKERRRAIEAESSGVFDHDDPRDLLKAAREALKKALDGDPSSIGRAYNMLDQYLQHAA